MKPFKEDAEDLRLAVVLLRALPGWTQGQLATAAGIAPSIISDYERGKRKAPRAVVNLLAEAVGIPQSMLERILPVLRSFRESLGGPPPPGISASEAALEDLVEKTGNLLRAAGELLLGTPSWSVFPPEPEDRSEAQELWGQLGKLETADRRLLVGFGEEYKTWAVSELLCHESAKAAGENADRAVELADLALLVAELTPVSSDWSHRLQGYAWGHVGNARRSRGDLSGAEEAFRRAESLWRAGASAEPDLLDKWRLLALEPSLALGEEDEI